MGKITLFCLGFFVFVFVFSTQPNEKRSQTFSTILEKEKEFQCSSIRKYGLDFLLVCPHVLLSLYFLLSNVDLSSFYLFILLIIPV